MNPSSPFSSPVKRLMLLLGDVIVLYGALALTVAVHSRGIPFGELFPEHIAPFTFLFAVWIVVFYIAGLYELRRLPNTLNFLKILTGALVVNLAIGISYFYLTPRVGITPKTNLLIFFVIFAIAESMWRPTMHRFLRSNLPRIRVLLVGTGETAQAIDDVMKENPQLGYTVAFWVNRDEGTLGPDELAELVGRHGIELVVVPWAMKFNTQTAQMLYMLFRNGVEIRDFPTFYEQLARRVPLSELGEPWLLEHLADHQRLYDPLKRMVEFVLALALQLALLKLEILIGFIIFITSGWPVFHKQKRVGQNGEVFTIYKFRTFTREASSRGGVQFAKSNDRHITGFGKLLRATHVDEFPQLVNILRGELSFVGPRAEWQELAATYAKEVPYYAVRQLVKPGLTGWAQINYPATPSIEDTVQKLQYDLYYIKNRSPLLDLTIIIKTLKSFFVNPK